mmetsp:Transcript_11202/g.45140  ORF Transcript_11202/g.45140 Transcript_11202/m.45140 type:complete len:290 (-) Transcript_11202:1892-2761(-)
MRVQLSLGDDHRLRGNPARLGLLRRGVGFALLRSSAEPTAASSFALALVRGVWPGVFVVLVGGVIVAPRKFPNHDFASAGARGEVEVPSGRGAHGRHRARRLQHRLTGEALGDPHVSPVPGLRLCRDPVHVDRRRGLRQAAEVSHPGPRRVMRPAHGVRLRGFRAILQLLLVLRAFLVRRVVFRFVVAGVRRRRRLGVARARGSRVFLWRKRRHLHAPPHAGRRRRLAYGLRVVEHQPPRPAPLHLPEHELARVSVDPGLVRRAGFVLVVRTRRGPLNLHRRRHPLRVQ